MQQENSKILVLQNNPSIQRYHTEADKNYPVLTDTKDYIGDFVMFDFFLTTNPMQYKGSKIVSVFDESKNLLITENGDLLRPISTYQFEIVELCQQLAKDFVRKTSLHNLTLAISTVPEKVAKTLENKHYYVNPYIYMLYTVNTENGKMVFAKFKSSNPDDENIMIDAPLCSVENFCSVNDSFRKDWYDAETKIKIGNVRKILDDDKQYAANFDRKQIHYAIKRN